MTDRIPLLVGVLGTEVAVLAPGPVFTQLRTLLAGLESSGPPTRRLVLEECTDGRFRLLDGGALVRAGVEPVVAAATIVWRLNAIAAATEQHLLVHAGVVGGVGAAILPGRSGAGKSTLVAACVAEGMAYLSDEYAAVDLDQGTVVPYPKPIGLEGEQLVAPSDLGAGPVQRVPVPVAGIAFPRYEEGSRTSRTSVDAGWTLLALAAHTTNLTALGGRALPWLAGLAASRPAWQVTYCETAGAVAVVREAANVVVAPLRPADELEAITPTTTTVVLGEGLAVLDGTTGRIHLLNASAAFVWRCVADAPDPTRLVETVLERAPDGALDRVSVRATVERLGASGLLADG